MSNSNEDGCAIKSSNVGFYENGQGNNQQPDAEGHCNCTTAKRTKVDRWNCDMNSSVNHLEADLNQGGYDGTSNVAAGIATQLKNTLSMPSITDIWFISFIRSKTFIESSWTYLRSYR